MFLRKLFSSKNKFTWVLIDLLIVITGVYCAFLIQSYAEQDKTNKEKDKIYTALKYELEIFRFTAAYNSQYMYDHIKKWRAAESENKYIDFSGWRFIEPQYSYQIIEHSIKIDNSNIIDFELYDALQGFYVDIKKVEYAERLITKISMRHKSIPSSIDLSIEKLALIKSENFDNFKRFILFASDREKALRRIISSSAEVLKTLNKRIDPEKRKEIEGDLITKKMPDYPKVETALRIVKQFFPNWSEEEILEIYNEVHGTKKSEADSPQ